MTLSQALLFLLKNTATALVMYAVFKPYAEAAFAIAGALV